MSAKYVAFNVTVVANCWEALCFLAKYCKGLLWHVFKQLQCYGRTHSAEATFDFEDGSRAMRTCNPCMQQEIFVVTLSRKRNLFETRTASSSYCIPLRNCLHIPSYSGVCDQALFYSCVIIMYVCGVLDGAFKENSCYHFETHAQSLFRECYHTPYYVYPGISCLSEMHVYVHALQKASFMCNSLHIFLTFFEDCTHIFSKRANFAQGSE